MADIKQAAKWLKEGRRVRRPINSHSISLGLEANEGISPDGLLVVFVNCLQRDREVQEYAPITVEQILADDWEIAE